MTKKKNTKPTSEKQREANRRNAQKSTEPRTPEGKDRSRLNATKHGYFLNVTPVLDSGPFAEDADVLVREIGEIVQSLKPRDAVELAQATMVARH